MEAQPVRRRRASTPTTTTETNLYGARLDEGVAQKDSTRTPRKRSTSRQKDGGGAKHQGSLPPRPSTGPSLTTQASVPTLTAGGPAKPPPIPTPAAAAASSTPAVQPGEVRGPAAAPGSGSGKRRQKSVPAQATTQSGASGTARAETPELMGAPPQEPAAPAEKKKQRPASREKAAASTNSLEKPKRSASHDNATPHAAAAASPRQPERQKRPPSQEKASRDSIPKPPPQKSPVPPRAVAQTPPRPPACRRPWDEAANAFHAKDTAATPDSPSTIGSPSVGISPAAPGSTARGPLLLSSAIRQHDLPSPGSVASVRHLCTSSPSAWYASSSAPTTPRMSAWQQEPSWTPRSVGLALTPRTAGMASMRRSGSYASGVLGTANAFLEELAMHGKSEAKLQGTPKRPTSQSPSPLNIAAASIGVTPLRLNGMARSSSAPKGALKRMPSAEKADDSEQRSNPHISFHGSGSLASVHFIDQDLAPSERLTARGTPSSPATRWGAAAPASPANNSVSSSGEQISPTWASLSASIQNRLPIKP
eukprot:TRINITY_DN10706_c0_g1_i1.p1 TRINITY_DN10706_c0_g1~~TRINITY_DN10706_c0_g1_i1.p1  ORF type:complete len:536 (+),score=75.02 TRINITY_DN10706_c0_g1_i1:177-1784(+)